MKLAEVCSLLSTNCQPPLARWDTEARLHHNLRLARNKGVLRVNRGARSWNQRLTRSRKGLLHQALKVSQQVLSWRGQRVCPFEPRACFDPLIIACDQFSSKLHCGRNVYNECSERLERLVRLRQHFLSSSRLATPPPEPGT